MRYVYIPLPVISGGNPGIVYYAVARFGMRLRSDLRLDFAHPLFSFWRAFWSGPSRRRCLRQRLVT
jgi:hypothetical protein